MFFTSISSVASISAILLLIHFFKNPLLFLSQSLLMVLKTTLDLLTVLFYFLLGFQMLALFLELIFLLDLAIQFFNICGSETFGSSFICSASLRPIAHTSTHNFFVPRYSHYILCLGSRNILGFKPLLLH